MLTSVIERVRANDASAPGRTIMKRLVETVTASSVLVMLLSSIVPAHAASHDGAMAPAGESTFHALSRMRHQGRRNLTPLTDDELASFTRPQLLSVQADPRTSSRSDRLRGGLAQASPLPERSGPPDTPTLARPPQPSPTQERALSHQPARPWEAASPRGRGEPDPDPRDVIDWLLRRGR
jgi:hypothetical protein